MSSKVDLLKKQIAELQAQLEVEMAKNTNISDGTLPTRTLKKKPQWNKQLPKERSLKSLYRLERIQKVGYGTNYHFLTNF